MKRLLTIVSIKTGDTLQKYKLYENKGKRQVAEIMIKELDELGVSIVDRSEKKDVIQLTLDDGRYMYIVSV
ncbi:hypothetical protein [Sporosarcina sp. FSL W7-1283]|uniref:hypothetical protein n=1 Tax=Sporosarcina sp. FSL W7-1283 TaxID=2921560 RepID=UPI0030F6E07D